MAKQTINIGASANDGSGDPIRNAFDKTNDNFNELYFALGGPTQATSMFNAQGELDFPNKAHKVSAYYATLGALQTVSASTYKGCIGYTADNQNLYYSNGTDWVQLAKYSDVTGTLVTEAFKTISVAGQNDVVADAAADTLTLVAGTNVTLTTSDTNDSITISASGGGSGSSSFVGLSDTPGSLGTAGQYVRVNSAANALEFASLDYYTDADVNTHLNQSTAGNGEVLSWNGSDYEWVAQSGGSSGVTVQDEGSALATAGTTLNFVGSGVTASGTGAVKTITIPGASGSTDLNSLTAATVNVAADSIGFIDADDSNNSKKESIVDFVAGIAGTGLTASAGQLSVSGGGGGSSATRNTEAETTASIADGAAGNVAYADLGVSYVLYSVQTDKAAWVRIYDEVASRTADASRNQGQDPAEGSGVIAEFITGGAATVKVTPGVFGWVGNSETTVPVSVTNLSGSTGTVQVTITALTLET